MNFDGIRIWEIFSIKKILKSGRGDNLIEQDQDRERDKTSGEFE